MLSQTFCHTQTSCLGHVVTRCLCVNIVEVARANEEKFRKMKGIYTKLREEHVGLLRTVS